MKAPDRTRLSVLAFIKTTVYLKAVTGELRLTFNPKLREIKHLMCFFHILKPSLRALALSPQKKNEMKMRPTLNCCRSPNNDIK